MKQLDPFRTLDEPHAEPAAAPVSEWLAGGGHLMKRSPYTTRLIIGEGLYLVLPGLPPARWYRFWTRVLLGWKWEQM